MMDEIELLHAQEIARRYGLPIPSALDRRSDASGLDDGPYLPGRAPRKPLPPKSRSEHAATRAKAWETRRARYGAMGHA